MISHQLSGFGQGLCVTQSDSPKTQTAGRVLTEQAGARQENRTRSGVVQGSVVGDRRLVGLPERRKPGLVKVVSGRKVGVPGQQSREIVEG